jgi:hypothetical protein
MCDGSCPLRHCFDVMAWEMLVVSSILLVISCLGTSVGMFDLSSYVVSFVIRLRLSCVDHVVPRCKEHPNRSDT